MSTSGAHATMDGLRDRLLTALVLSLITVAAVLWLPRWALALAMLPAVGVAIWELSLLLGLTRMRARLAYLVGFFALLIIGWRAGLLVFPGPVLLPVALLWLVLASWVFRRDQVPLVTGVDVRLLLLSLPIMLAPWLGVLALHAAPGGGPWLVLFVLMLVWLTDSAAYFAGRRFGRRKLAPMLSPGKTVEGVIGGLVAAGLWSLALIPLAGEFIDWLWLALLCLLSAAVSVVCDLVESWLKRRRQLKDTGSLLPGHGGMLDRLDSLVAAVPVFTVGFLLLERTL